jgi:hypothetical protein
MRMRASAAPDTSIGPTGMAKTGQTAWIAVITAANPAKMRTRGKTWGVALPW